MKEESESLHWPIFDAALCYSTRVFFLLLVLSRAINPICSRNRIACHDLKEPKPLPWPQQSDHPPLPRAPEPAPLLTA